MKIVSNEAIWNDEDYDEKALVAQSEEALAWPRLGFGLHDESIQGSSLA